MESTIRRIVLGGFDRGTGGGVLAGAADPHRPVDGAETPALDDVATEVHDRFERVLAAVAEELGPASEA
jgi:hypothetical protein